MMMMMWLWCIILPTRRILMPAVLFVEFASAAYPSLPYYNCHTNRQLLLLRHGFLFINKNNNSNNNNNNSNDCLLTSILSPRGGEIIETATLNEDDEEDDVENYDDDNIFDNDDYEEKIQVLDNSDSDEESQPPEEEEEEEEDADDVENQSPSSSSTTSAALPVKIHIRTGLNSPLLDQQLEFTASTKRTISSLKQAISKTMPGRPPLSCIQLRYRGRLLGGGDGNNNDNEENTTTTSSIMVKDILSQEDEDEDEKQDDDDDDDDDEEEDTLKLSLTCDILPPIDSKFGIEFRKKIVTLSTKEIMDAYCLNMAGMMYGQEEQCLLWQEEIEKKEEEEESNRRGIVSSLGETNTYKDNDENKHVWDTTSTGNTVSTAIGSDGPSLHIRKKAAFLRKQLDSMLTSETKQLIEEEHARVMRRRKKDDVAEEVTKEEDDDNDEEEMAFGLRSMTPSNAVRSRGRSRNRNRKGSRGGATMIVKKALQKNLNVNWADTTRNSLLFLFFGYFGGRNSFSRTFLLLSSPLCFFIQTRPVKVAMKQLFYTIGEPPGILLSLLPAPQQAIMSCDYGRMMKGLYDEKMLEGEEWLEMERLEMERLEQEEEEEEESGGGGYVLDDSNDDDGYDQYDDDTYADEDY